MNPQIKVAWAEALRSGDYAQGDGGLRNKQDQYCCLGVLCDLAVRAGIVDAELEPMRENWSYQARGAGIRHTGYLPKVVIEWAGLPDGDPTVRTPQKHLQDRVGPSLLSLVNDVEKLTFAQIADLIEEQL